MNSDLFLFSFLLSFPVYMRENKPDLYFSEDIKLVVLLINNCGKQNLSQS